MAPPTGLTDGAIAEQTPSSPTCGPIAAEIAPVDPVGGPSLGPKRRLSHAGSVSDTSGASTSSAGSPVAACAAKSPKPVKYRSISSTDVRESRPATTAGATARSGDEEVVVLVRPKLRGKIHLMLLFLAPIWTLLLLNACRSLLSFVAAAVSCLSFLANFAASALLHSGSFGPQWSSLFVKLDHAGIFVVISSCTTPIPLLLLDFWPSVLLLSVQGLATLYGFWTILFGNLSSGARQRRALTYILIGLLHACFLRVYISVLTLKEFSLVIFLALFYIIGALVYGHQWPDPFPSLFGFHELFHLFCCISFVLTLWLNYEVISRAESSMKSSIS